MREKTIIFFPFLYLIYSSACMTFICLWCPLCSFFLSAGSHYYPYLASFLWNSVLCVSVCPCAYTQQVFVTIFGQFWPNGEGHRNLWQFLWKQAVKDGSNPLWETIRSDIRRKTQDIFWIVGLMSLTEISVEFYVWTYPPASCKNFCSYVTSASVKYYEFYHTFFPKIS